MDDDRIRDFVDGEYTKVVATVALVCGSVATAEDSVQEALARAWERLDRGDDIDRLAAWVTTVALNLARSQMRRWRSERRARDRLGPLRDDQSNAPAASG
ncbi:MAG TPA: sigma factor, partial [Acidimicrobiia bacterium]|nr:sigma factor [Acidimicrobiia bacterium]